LGVREPMPIARLLEYEAFSPEDVSLMTGAFESAVSVLRLTDRDDPETVERVARKIIECARTGEHDPLRLRSYAIRSL
jgi:hypothetical protein